ncbi:MULTISPECIES: hypothetical protein [Sphingobacterium]|nr:MULTISPECIES: hypothetical protein [Sphingobacterium]
MDDLLKKLRDEQRTTKDPLRLQQLANETKSLTLQIPAMEYGYKDVTATIAMLEDELYSLSVSNQQNSEEFATKELFDELVLINRQIMLKNELLNNIKWK